MMRATRRSRRLPAMLLAAAAAMTGACGGGGGGPTSPPPPMTDNGFATFRLSGAGYDEVVSYAGGTNLVFCRRAAGWADLWIRFAQEPSGNGGGGPHLDIDLCNHGDGGTFAPKDPHATTCGGGQTWDIFWHDEAATFVNSAAAPSCTFSLTRNGSMLTGTFSCRGLTELGGGGGTLDVLDGSFRCTEE